MADQFNLDSKTFKRVSTQPMPTPTETQFPSRDEYVGAAKASDAETVLAPMGTPKQAVPGSFMPGERWKSVEPAMRKRGALR